MQAHRTSTTVSGDGSVTVSDLPFSEGEEVEVIVLPRQNPGGGNADRMPLRGSVRHYERPFEPAIRADDWDAA